MLNANIVYVVKYLILCLIINYCNKFVEFICVFLLREIQLLWKKNIYINKWIILKYKEFDINLMPTITEYFPEHELNNVLLHNNTCRYCIGDKNKLI